MSSDFPDALLQNWLLQKKFHSDWVYTDEHFTLIVYLCGSRR